jgi:hypothetical protein
VVPQRSSLRQGLQVDLRDGDFGWRLRRQGEFQLLEQQAKLDIRFGMADKLQFAAVSGRRTPRSACLTADRTAPVGSPSRSVCRIAFHCLRSLWRSASRQLHTGASTRRAPIISKSRRAGSLGEIDSVCGRRIERDCVPRIILGHRAMISCSCASHKVATRNNARSS